MPVQQVRHHVEPAPVYHVRTVDDRPDVERTVSDGFDVQSPFGTLERRTSGRELPTTRVTGRIFASLFVGEKLGANLIVGSGRIGEACDPVRETLFGEVDYKAILGRHDTSDVRGHDLGYSKACSVSCAQGLIAWDKSILGGCAVDPIGDGRSN